MRQFRLFGGIEGYYRFMQTVLSINRSQGNTTAIYRLKVLEHFWKHGLVSTLSAFPVSRATLFRWQKELCESGGKLQSLIPQSTKPKRVRQMQVPRVVVNKIRQLRETWPNISKHKLKPLLDVFCLEQGCPCISVTTIGKVVNRNNYFFARSSRMYHNPIRKRGLAKAKVESGKLPSRKLAMLKQTVLKLI